MTNIFLKKISLAFVTLGAVASLAACGNVGETSKGSDGDAAGKTEISIFQFKVEFKDQFEALAKKYEEENPDIKINIETVGGGSDYGAALKSKFSSGNEPNIFNIGGPEDVNMWLDSLTDLSDTEAAKQALDGTLTGATKDDKVLGLPYNIEGYGILYNKEIFEEAGIDATTITTLADLEKAAETLEKQKAELGIEAPFALAAKEQWITGLHSANAFLNAEFNNDVMQAFESKEVAFEYGDAFKKYIDWMNKYSVQPANSLDYSQQIEQLFANGKVAMTQQGNWVYPTIEGIDETLANEKIGLLPIPIDGVVEGKIPVGVPMYWGVNSNGSEEEIQAAKDFLDYLYTSEEGKQIVLEDFKFVPAYQGYDTDKISDPLSKDVYTYYTEGNTTGWVFMGYPAGWGEQSLGAEIQKYVAGDASWEEVISTVQKKWAEERK
ncbi:raffinose/stachyose/melibiose transport system substrate-binding protein [Enterococcus sp. PF1-24]|uniref:ABC transporter substrate-binding protein n=1 Tax=unclassified Enterococcus TaxID=2608891 RepID=UPI0024765E4D|nr:MULTISPECIES: ABC transporter substrate-binding protein [unclassified Enterococcus]MDH6363825.1 raffinose/stachyose/melibiose transport system substrate-binding protein [Enterococcus sp. PFB1-1]MDH6400989.1 raffinose/stachyose/melibiose transport system substrate-binding protein [Enterococcus sp. PF1-24]